MSLRILALLCLTATLLACGERGRPDHDHDHADDAATTEFERGPHGGRLLREGDLSVELAIYELGVPPEFRAWLYRDDRALPPEDGQLEVVLTRLGGRTETHRFSARGDHLVGDGVVHEPHSFDVAVQARIGAVSLRWTYPSYEGRTRIAATVADAAGIRVAPAEAGPIRTERELIGRLRPADGRVVRLAARFPGPIRSLQASVGDRVRVGQVLATIESNASLTSYDVSAPIDGVVLRRTAELGELVGEAPLFEVADLSVLWAELYVYADDAGRIAAGQPVRIARLADGFEIASTVERVLPLMAEDSQTLLARASIDNGEGRFRPGEAVRARVLVAEEVVPLRVPRSALQRFRDGQVVFIRVGEDYEIRPVEVGRGDERYVEVLAGIEHGDPIVVEQSFLVKADIEKAGAAHDH